MAGRMGEQKEKDRSSELRKRLQILMFLRVVFVSVILGSLIFVRFRGTHLHITHAQTAPYILLAVIYFTNIIYVLLLKKLGRLILQAYFQLFFDSLFIAVFVYATGGIDSIFSFLFILNIICGSILLYRRGGLLLASADSILYGLLLDLHYYGLIHPLGNRVGFSAESYDSAYLFYTILVNMAGFYLVGYLSGFLAEQTRKSRDELKETRLDLDKLVVLHESIINSIRTGLIVLDQRDRILLFNPASEKILGIRSDQLYGRFFKEALPGLWEYSDFSNGEDSADKIRTFKDIVYHRSNDERIFLRVSVSPLRYRSGNEEGKMLVVQDVTEIKQIEEDMKKVESLALVGEMAAGIAHEIRNPMASISGSIEVLKEGASFDSTERRLMDIVSREIDRLNHLIRDFLLFARPKKIQFKSFDLNQIVEEALEFFQKSPRWNEKIQVIKRFADAMDIESDPDMLRQVLSNLFVNALESMSAGGTLEIVTRWDHEPVGSKTPRAAIIVRDSGRGFAETVLSKLFTPFFTTKEGGSGLGLATVKRIVDALKGKISAGNQSGGGAEIVVVIPAFTPSVQKEYPADNAS